MFSKASPVHYTFILQYSSRAAAFRERTIVDLFTLALNLEIDCLASKWRIALFKKNYDLKHMLQNFFRATFFRLISFDLRP